MYKMKYLVEAIHGNLSQSRRTKAMEGFRSGKYMFMIATDVAARGLDIKGVSHVINYNVPHDPKDYVHRIGRTGRAGHIGKAITFVTDRDLEFLKGIEWYIDMNIKKVHYEISPEDKKLAEYSSRRGNFREQRYGGQRRSYGNQRQQNNSSDNKRSNPSKYALGDY
jgi:ATP-dependent RNA helicase DeaD